MITCHNEELHIDLPVHIRFMNTKRYDSVGGFVSPAKFRSLNSDIHFQNLFLDSANGNYGYIGALKAHVRSFGNQ